MALNQSHQAELSVLTRKFKINHNFSSRETHKTNHENVWQGWLIKS